MPSYAEPPNGDFVAYIEQLQRESAARILAQSKQVMVEPPAGQALGTGSSATTTALDARMESAGYGGYGFGNAAQLLARLASERARAQQVGTAISLVIGVALIFYWFASRSGVVPLLLGVGLLVWSIRKLRRGTAQRADAHADAGRTAISKVFGNRPHNP
jgi:hypothetical protein